MKIFENCWNALETCNCQYGAHIFENDSAMIYVNHWLDVDSNLRGYFYRKNDQGFVGHCLLVFHGVKKFDFVVNQYTKQGEKIIWHEPVSFNYLGTTPETETTKYMMEGSLHGFPSSVQILVEALAFELRILGKDEPASQS